MSRIWVKNSPITMVEGETITFSVRWLGATSVSSTTATVYRRNSDYTSTAMPSGSTSESGSISTLKPLVAASGDGGTSYILAISATVDGNTEIRKCEVVIQKANKTQ